MLDIRGLTVEYEGANGYTVRPLENLDVHVADGDLAVLLGPSGCGKTTLLSCLAGLLTPAAGTIHFGGTEVTALAGTELTAYRRSVVGIVFQAFNLVRSLTARENVMAPMLLSGVRRRAAGERADHLLETVGLAERRKHRPSSLSGGQQQRVAIARALVHDPPLILADEPTAHLDHIQVEGILQLLRELAVPGRTIVVSTHDDRVTRLADRVIELAARGETAMATEPQEVTLETGQILFDQGDHAELIYVVEEGEIGLIRVRSDGSEKQIGAVPAGQYFGELGPLLSMPRSCTAVATRPTRVTGYPLHQFSRGFPKIRQQMPGYLTSLTMPAIQPDQVEQ